MVKVKLFCLACRQVGAPYLTSAVFYKVNCFKVLWCVSWNKVTRNIWASCLIGINQGGTEALLLLPGSGPWEDAPEGKEFWYLVALWFSQWNSQHVQRVQRPDHLWSCHAVLWVHPRQSLCLDQRIAACFIIVLETNRHHWFSHTIKVLLDHIALLSDRDMGARHRARAHSIQIMKVQVIPANKCRRPAIKQFHVSIHRPTQISLDWVLVLFKVLATYD